MGLNTSNFSLCLVVSRALYSSRTLAFLAIPPSSPVLPRLLLVPSEVHPGPQTRDLLPTHPAPCSPYLTPGQSSSPMVVSSTFQNSGRRALKARRSLRTFRSDGLVNSAQPPLSPAGGASFHPLPVSWLAHIFRVPAMGQALG